MTVIQTRIKELNFRKGTILGLAFFTAIGATAPANATIDNEAVASGTFNGGTITSPPDDESVPVVPLDNGLTVAKSVFAAPSIAAGANAAITDEGDTIVYRYTVTNTGNATETDISINDAGPSFDGNSDLGTLSAITEVAGVGTGTAATLQPGQTVVFEASYTLDELDILNAAGVTDGVSNIATATSTDVPLSPPSPPAETTIPAYPLLEIAKVATLNDEVNADSQAEVGETITYVYTVTNTGNVAITSVGIQDTHEGAVLSPAPGNETITSNGPLAVSSDTTANDSTVDILGPGAVATFTYVHTVTQTEVNNQ